MELAPDEVADLNKLTPTDARILEVLREGRNVPANIADTIDRNARHVSTRLSQLRERGYIRKVGRETSSLYEITGEGRRVSEAHREFQRALAD